MFLTKLFNVKSKIRTSASVQIKFSIRLNFAHAVEDYRRAKVWPEEAPLQYSMAFSSCILATSPRLQILLLLMLTFSNQREDGNYFQAINVIVLVLLVYYNGGKSIWEFDNCKLLLYIEFTNHFATIVIGSASPDAVNVLIIIIYLCSQSQYNNQGEYKLLHFRISCF